MTKWHRTDTQDRQDTHTLVVLELATSWQLKRAKAKDIEGGVYERWWSWIKCLLEIDHKAYSRLIIFFRIKKVVSIMGHLNYLSLGVKVFWCEPKFLDNTNWSRDASIAAKSFYRVLRGGQFSMWRRSFFALGIFLGYFCCGSSSYSLPNHTKLHKDLTWLIWDMMICFICHMFICCICAFMCCECVCACAC